MLSDTLREEFARLLHVHVKDLHTNGVKVTGCVPWREDNHPSFSADLEKGVWYDHARQEGGGVKEFKDRVRANGAEQAGRRIVASYDYLDENGTLLYQAVRFEPKGFAQRSPGGNGGWTWKLTGVTRVLYRLPEILKVETVYIVEGEKDADRLWSMGIPATTNPQGAGKWREEYSESLRDKQVVIVPDNDDVGEQHALQVARSLLPVAKAVKIVRLPGLPAKGDVSGWLEAGHTNEELFALVTATPILKAEDLQRDEGKQQRQSKATLVHLADVVSQPVKWLWRGYIPLGKLTILDGDPGLGKSLLTLDIAARVTTARAMPESGVSDLTEPANVILLSAEDDPADTLRPRLEVAKADLTRVVALTAIREEDNERFPCLGDLSAIRETLVQTNAKLLIVDPFMAYLSSEVNSFRDQDIRRILAPFSALAAETRAAVVVVRHLNKSTGGNPLYRGGGSIGIIGAARSGLLVAKDPDDDERRILAVTKSNLAKIPSALAYHVIASANDIPSITWQGVTAHTASALLVQQNNTDEDRSALDEAKDFIRETLYHGGKEVKEIHKEARNAGISEATLRRAKTVLQVVVKKQGNFLAKEQKWVWSLPEGAQDLSEDAQTREHAHLQANIEKNTRNDADFSEGAQGSENEHLQGANEHLQEEAEFHTDSREDYVEEL
jgi:putative DNA primase/helicase